MTYLPTLIHLSPVERAASPYQKFHTTLLPPRPNSAISLFHFLLFKSITDTVAAEKTLNSRDQRVCTTENALSSMVLVGVSTIRDVSNNRSRRDVRVKQINPSYMLADAELRDLSRFKSASADC